MFLRIWSEIGCNTSWSKLDVWTWPVHHICFNGISRISFQQVFIKYTVLKMFLIYDFAKIEWKIIKQSKAFPTLWHPFTLILTFYGGRILLLGVLNLQYICLFITLNNNIKRLAIFFFFLIDRVYSWKKSMSYVRILLLRLGKLNFHNMCNQMEKPV